MAEIAAVFHWSKADILADYWDELLLWHAEATRIYNAMRGHDD